MTSEQLEHAQKRMQQKWYDLAMAEQRGASLQVLERMYNSYVLAMEEYNRCSEEYQHQVESGPIPVRQKKLTRSNPSAQEDEHKKKAS